MSDLYSLVAIDHKTPLYLPSTFVRIEQEKLVKAHKAAAGRIFSDYKHVQTGIGPGLDKPQQPGLAFDLLRQLADNSPIDRLIIDTRMTQIKRVARRSIGRDSIGFAVKHIRDSDPDFEVPEGLRNLAKQIEDVLSKPTAPFHASIRDFLATAVEEELTIDRKAMVITRDRRGRPVRFHLIDGATVRPVPWVVFEAIQKEYNDKDVARILSPTVYADALYKLSIQSGFDLTSAAYVQIVDGQMCGAWKADELAIDITNPSVRLNEWGYGRSSLERSWRLSQSFLKAWTYNDSLFDLNYPEAVLAVMGAYDEDGLAAFKRKVLGEGDGRANNWRLPVIPMSDAENSKIEMVKLRDTPKDMLFGEWIQGLIRLKCAAYRMHPSLINWSQDSQGGITFQGGTSDEQAIALSQEEGFHGLLDNVADWLSRTIVQEYHDELVATWIGLDEQSEDAKIERATKEVQSYSTINETRKKRGLPKMPKEIPTEPGDFIGSYEQAIQIIQGQQQQAQQQGGPGYDQGDFGQGGAGDDDQGGAPGAPQNGLQAAQGTNAQTPQAPAPQFGGPQHPDEESAVLRRSRGAAKRVPDRYVRIAWVSDDD